MREWMMKNSAVFLYVAFCIIAFIIGVAVGNDIEARLPEPTIVTEAASFIHTLPDGSTVEITAQADMLDDIVLAYMTAAESAE